MDEISHARRKAPYKRLTMIVRSDLPLRTLRTARLYQLTVDGEPAKVSRIVEAAPVGTEKE